MIEVVIDSIRVSLTNQQRIVVLREVNKERYLPIWIGPFEAEAITIAMQEIEVARPQTHDLVKNIIKQLDARLVRVEVVALQEDVFFGVLVLEVNGHEVRIDSRPSDALALAARVHIPILVAYDVMNTACLIPEEEVQQEGALLAPLQGEEPDDTSSRLSVFEDFLKDLDFNLPDDQSGDDEEPPEEPDQKQ